MPQRAVLTEEQRAALLALPEGEPELVRHWTLGADDLRAIVNRKRPHDRLGFAVQLCALRYPGRLLRPGELVPHAPLAFVADQLDVVPEVLADYAPCGPNRYEQLDTLRDVFGFRQLSRPASAELQTWLLPVALTTTSGAEFARMLLAEFRNRQIIVPGGTLVERMVAQALLDAERHVAELLTRISPPISATCWTRCAVHTKTPRLACSLVTAAARKAGPAPSAIGEPSMAKSGYSRSSATS